MGSHNGRKVHRLDFRGNGTQTSDLPYNLCMMQYMKYGIRHVNISRVEVKTTVPQNNTTRVVSCPDGVLPPWEVSILLTLLERLKRPFVLRPKVLVDVDEKTIKI
jgi:hypothetical protein